jgi:hypothetical protein
LLELAAAVVVVVLVEALRLVLELAVVVEQDLMPLQ